MATEGRRTNHWVYIYFVTPDLDLTSLLFSHLGYARVVGELESFRSFKSVKIQNIRPIFVGDEIFHHFIHAIYDTVVCERGLPVSRLSTCSS